MTKYWIWQFFRAVLLASMIYTVLTVGYGILKSKTNVVLKQKRTEIYLDVFNKDIRDSLKRTITSLSNHREPISYFRYKKNYEIAVWEFLTNNNKPLTIEEISLPSEVESFKGYQGMNIKGVDTYLTRDSLIKKDTLFFYLKGDVKKALISDSLVVYSTLLKETSLSYEDGGSTLFYANPKLVSPAKKYPSEFAFYRKDSRNYIVMMFPINDDNIEEVSLGQLLE